MGLGLGLGFSTKAMRVRAAGAAGSTWTVGAAADAAMWRVCTGPVRSVWGALNCRAGFVVEVLDEPVDEEDHDPTPRRLFVGRV